MSYRKGKTESIKWIRIPFPSRRGKMENENGSPISFFYCIEKRKNENKIWVSFSYTIENRLALRYTDFFSWRIISGEYWPSAYFCLLDRCKTKNRLDNSKYTLVLDVRLKIVIVISVKTKLGNFEEHCSRVAMFISKRKLNNTECIVQIKREISPTRVCLTCKHHATFLKNDELFIA